MRVRSFHHRPLTIPLRLPVHAQRVRRIIFPVGPVEPAVENIIGAKVDEPPSEIRSLACHHRWGIGIHPAGKCGIILTGLKGRRAGSIHHNIP